MLVFGGAKRAKMDLGETKEHKWDGEGFKKKAEKGSKEILSLKKKRGYIKHYIFPSIHSWCFFFKSKTACFFLKKAKQHAAFFVKKSQKTIKKQKGN